MVQLLTSAPGNTGFAPFPVASRARLFFVGADPLLLSHFHRFINQFYFLDSIPNWFHFLLFNSHPDLGRSQACSQRACCCTPPAWTPAASFQQSSWRTACSAQQSCLGSSFGCRTAFPRTRQPQMTEQTARRKSTRFGCSMEILCISGPVSN